MIYEYECQCGYHFEVVKKVEARNEPEHCRHCHRNDVMRREVPSSFLLQKTELADWNTGEHYNPALGTKVKNNLHAKKIAKSKGMTEIGNEDPNKAEKEFKKARKRKASYDISDITNLGEIRS